MGRKCCSAFIMALVSLLVSTICFAGETKLIEREELQSGSFTYSISDDWTVSISKWNGEDDILRIPDVIDGKEVTSIDEYAFAFCNNLSSIEIPDSITTIEGNPFLGCGSLNEVIISPYNDYYAVIDNVLYDKKEKSIICYLCGGGNSEYIIPEGIKAIGSTAFSECNNLTSIKIPDSVTKIGKEAFRACANLRNIELPNSLTTIGEAAFIDCGNLANIELPESLASIEGYAFYDCANMSSIEIPDSVTTIGANPFVRCSSLTRIIISPDHENYAVIDQALFDKKEKSIISYLWGSSNSEYRIPKGIKTIGASAFSNCESLTSIKIPDSVTTIGEDAFFNCKNLTSVELPDSVTTIEKGAFFGCVKLPSIELPDSVTTIGDYALSSCEKLTLTVGRDSYAKQYAEDNDIPYTYRDANDWLNE